MLYDRAKIYVEGGGGGNGCVSFRREAHVPHGGPDGGDGGRGGDVVLESDPSRRDLASLHRSRHFRAGRGGHGQGKQRHGARGEDRVVPVPPGTQVEGLEGARYDLVEAGQRATVAAGGAGGHGNKRFTSPTRQTPRFAERGLEGESGWIELQLKLLADAGLIGLPNAGKSSLLARLTRAAPKGADYPFTTLEPVLGTLERDGRQLVLADIPGLIEGASAGAGLGHDFLAHVERCRLLVHVLDLAPPDGSEPAENFAAVEREIAAHDPRLAGLPRILALSKADLVPAGEADQAREAWKERVGAEAILTSAVTGEGVDAVATELVRRLPPKEDVEAEAPLAYKVFRPTTGREFDVRRTGEGAFRVTGEGTDRLIARHDIGNPDALEYLEQRLEALGVRRALEAAGFEPGDDVEIGGVVFELE